MAEVYDVVVIGAGSAGSTAAMFAAKYGYSTLLLDRLTGGGQILNAEKIENYPGFPEGTSGFELGPSMMEQAMNAGAEISIAEATGLRLEDPYRMVSTSEGEYKVKAVIIASGSSLRELGIPGEKELVGKGVSHCATCDGPFFQEQVIGVVGGGDSAMDEALTLSEYASQVVLFHRRDALSAQHVLQDRVLSNPKIQVRWNTMVDEVLGQDGVSGVKVRDIATEETSQVDLAGLFVYIGLDPNTAYLKDMLPLDNTGHISTDIWMKTEVPGVFAAGDIRQNSAAQIVTAAGDGATAAVAVHRYISGREWPD